MKIVLRHLLLIFVLCGTATDVYAASAGNKDEEPGKKEDTVEVKVSPQCAAVVLVLSGAAGAAAGYVLTPALCGAGFCSAGVAGGSLASWWQSTMPLVAKGSLFATLQSVAMGGSTGCTIAVGGSLGGAIGAEYMTDFCALVDEADPDSPEGQAIQFSHQSVKRLSDAAQAATDQCENSETCKAAMEMGEAAVATVANGMKSLTSLIATASEEMTREAAKRWNMDAKD